MRQPISFGKYLLLERINVGGMAEIFLARSRGMHGFKRILAIKKILPTMAEDEDFIAMFIDEARIAAELSHTGIVQIYELGKFENDYYISMEFVHGKDMRYIQERMARLQEPMDFHMAAFVAFRICEALDYAHSKRDPSGQPLNIAHRDISPQNVILSFDGEVKICDFGIAKAANRSQKTQAGVLKGKFGYMSPEQVRGLPLDGRSDIFTVGTLLYETITLERLFLGESDFSTLEKVRNADVLPPSKYNDKVPKELEDIILKALQKDVEDRFQSAADMAEALQVFLLRSKPQTSRSIAMFMKDTFSSEYKAELKRLEEYHEMPEPTLMNRHFPGGDEEEEDLDPDAKTQIFVSSDEPVSKPPDTSKPPPVPKRNKKKKEEDILDAKTMIFDEPGSADADAKTMIFDVPGSDGKSGEKTVIFDSGDKEVSQDFSDGLRNAGESLDKPRPSPKHKPHGARSRAEKLLLPLSVFLALLLGYSIIMTIRVLGDNEKAKDPPALELLTRPSGGVTVSIDGKPVSKSTPYAVHDLSEGTHELKVSKAGYEDESRTIYLNSGTRLVMKIEMHRTTPIRVAMNSTDNSGTKPPEQAPESDKGVDSESADVDGGIPETSDGGTKTDVVSMVTFSISSRPKGAEVIVNGKKVGSTPWTGQVKAGEAQKVALNLKGYRGVTKSVVPEPGKKNRLDLELSRVTPKPKKKARREYGFLLANTRPWSKVYLDGKYTGRETPIPPDKKLRLTVGTHKITFATPSGKKYDFQVEIKKDETLKLIKRLD